MTYIFNGLQKNITSHGHCISQKTRHYKGDTIKTDLNKCSLRNLLTLEDQNCPRLVHVQFLLLWRECQTQEQINHFPLHPLYYLSGRDCQIFWCPLQGTQINNSVNLSIYPATIAFTRTRSRISEKGGVNLKTVYELLRCLKRTIKVELYFFLPNYKRQQLTHH